MTSLETCNGYRTIAHVADDADLPAACRAAETAANDGFCVIATRSGRIIADAEGYCDGIKGPSGEGSSPYDAATATGMYDRY